VTSSPTDEPTDDSPAVRGRPRDSRADQRILAATFRQLIDVGYGALSIESVAAEAGVAKTTIYRRHPTKRDLVLAAMTAATPFEPPPAELPSREALAIFIRTAIHLLIESGAFRILGSFLLEERREPGLMATFRAHLLEPRRQMIETMLRRGIDRGEIRADIDPLIVTEMIAGAVMGHHVILGRTSSDAWIDALVDHVWHAIAVELPPGRDLDAGAGAVDSGSRRPTVTRQGRAT
jgi:AcrR family transcriptional regulator